MNIQRNQPMTTAQRHQAHGWTVSTFIHLCGIGGALMLMAEFERPALPQPLRFDITLVQPTPSQAASEPAPADISPPIPTRPPPPAPVPGRPIERRVQAKRVVATAQDVPRVTRDIVPAPARVVTQAIEEKAAARAQSIHETGQSISESAQEFRTTAPREMATQSSAVVQRSIVEPMTSMPVSQAVERAQPNEMDRMVEKTRTVEQAPASERSTIVTHKTSQHVPIASGVEHRAVMQRAVHTLPQTQADYGWLAESLWKRIEQLKRYPSQARTRRWEGKVILEAVIRDDGTIMELRIEESSGHAILDQDALAVVKKASPLALKHSLGQPQITILVPISYNLDG